MLDLLIEDPRWSDMDIARVGDLAVGAVLAHAGLEGATVEVSVLACDDARIAALNGDFRDKPAPTNVLSWPATDLAADTDGDLPSPPQPGPDGFYELGDVAIAYDICLSEARDLGKPLSEHATHLLVHGVLHLLGYDHIRERDAALMQDIERKILGKLGIDDPY